MGCVTATRPSHNLDRLFEALSEEVDVKYALTTAVVVLPNASGSISVLVEVFINMCCLLRVIL